MENVPPDLPIDYKIKVLSVDADARPPRAEVEVKGVRYRVIYQAPKDAPPLKKDQYLSVVVPAVMITVKPALRAVRLAPPVTYLDRRRRCGPGMVCCWPVPGGCT